MSYADSANSRYGNPCPSGAQIPFYRFKGREKHGITVHHNGISFSFRGCPATVERIDRHRHRREMDDRFEIKRFSVTSHTRLTSHVVAYLDRLTVYGCILNDDVSVADMLPQFTLAQIMDDIRFASENNCTNVLVLLMDHKNRTFADYDPMEEFSLDL